MNSEKLSRRLECVAEYVVQYGTAPIRVADIGSDHAYLPCYLLLNQQAEYAIAGEVVEGPFQSAQKEVQLRGLHHVIDVRKGDGLQVLTLADHINTVTICGMGGTLIRQILEEGHHNTHPNTVFILQANIGEAGLRTWLQANHFDIIDESIVEDAHRLYEIIVAIKNNTHYSLTLSEQLMGPHLLKRQGALFTKKWTKELANMKRIYKQMTTSDKVDEAKKVTLASQIEAVEQILFTNE